MNKQVKIKEPVKIRQKKLANGNISLILDTYINGKRKREYLKLYLIPEKTIADKKANKDTLEIAKAVQAKKILELKNDRQGFFEKEILSNASIILFITEVAEQSLEKTHSKQGNYFNFKSLNFHLEKYKGTNITFKDIDLDFCNGFVEYLKTAKSGNVPKKGETPNLSPTTLDIPEHPDPQFRAY